MGQVHAEGTGGQQDCHPSASPAPEQIPEQKEQRGGEHHGKDAPVGGKLLAVGAGHQEDNPGAQGDHRPAAQHSPQQHPPGWGLLQPLQPGAQQEVAQIPLQHAHIQRLVLPQQGVPGVGQKTAELIQAQGHHHPQPQQIPPVPLLHVVGQPLKQR